MRKEKLLFVLITFALFLSCNDDDDEPNISSKDYRISEIIFFNDSEEETKNILTYTNDKLTLMTRYEKDDDDVWVDDYKQEFVYAGNLVTQTSYRKNDLNWTISNKSELTFENGLMTEKLSNYYNNGIPSLSRTKYEFSFNGTMLLQYLQSSGSTVLEPKRKHEIIYTNDVLTKIDYFNFSEENWQKTRSENFTYNGNLLNENISTYINDTTIENSSKMIYNYTGNVVNSINIFDWTNDTWQSDLIVNYIYNAEGYLIGVNYDDIKYTINYEEGKGNTFNVLQDPYEQIYGYLYLFVGG